MHFVPIWWDFAQRGLSWIFNRETSELGPRGLCRAWWQLWTTCESLKLEAYCSRVTFFLCGTTLGIPNILPWKTVYCLLGIPDIIGIPCLYYFSKYNRKCTFWKKTEPVYLTAMAWTFLGVVSLIENSVWKRIFRLPSLLSSFKRGKIGTLLSKHFNRNNPQSEIYMKSLIIFIILFLLSY